MTIEGLLATTYRALGIDAEHQLKGPVPAGTQHVTIGVTLAFPEYSRRVVWAEKAFANKGELRDALAAQAADPDDPNPLPRALVTFTPLDTLVELESLDYNPVTGLEIGGEISHSFDAEDFAETIAAVGARFVDDLFDERD